MDVSRRRLKEEKKTAAPGGFGHFWLRLLEWIARGQQKAGACHT
ncbi:MAG: hypothetical protein WAM73_12480 [Desulfobacterales bacterium]